MVDELLALQTELAEQPSDDAILYIESGGVQYKIQYSNLLLGSAPAAQYVTLATDSVLDNERVLTGTANQIVVTDSGAGLAVTLSTPQNIHTGATPEFDGLNISATAGYDITPGSDTDTDLITLNVGGTPKLWWDESAGAFVLNENVRFAAGTGRAYFEIRSSASDALLGFLDNEGTARWELRDEGGTFELNRGANTNNIITVRGADAGAYTGFVGIGDSAPIHKLVVAGNLRACSRASVAYIEFRSGSDDMIVDFKNSSGTTRWEIRDDSGVFELNEGGNTNNRITVVSGGNAGFGGVASPSAQVHVDQASTTAAKPVLLLDQADISEGFVNFVGTSAASAAGPISTWTAGNSIQGFVRTEINGTQYWMPYYDAPTA